jgi:hypothetical protein
MNTKNSDLSKQTSRTERPRGGTTNSNEESEIARNECESMHHSEAHDSTKVKVDRTERQRRYGAEIPALTEPSNAADIQEKTSTSDTLTQGPDYKHQVQSEVHGRRGEHAIEEVPYLSTHQDLRRLHVQEEVGLDLQYTRAEGLEQQLITSDERSIAGAPLVSAHLVEEESRMIVEAVPMPRTEECHPDSTSPSSSKGDHEHTASPSRISSKLLPAAVVGANLVVGGIVVAGVCGSGHCSSHGSPTFLLSGVSDEGQQPLCDTSFVIWATCLRARPTACYNKCQKLGVVEFDYTCDDYESRQVNYLLLDMLYIRLPSNNSSFATHTDTVKELRAAALVKVILVRTGSVLRLRLTVSPLMTAKPGG